MSKQKIDHLKQVEEMVLLIDSCHTFRTHKDAIRNGYIYWHAIMDGFEPEERGTGGGREKRAFIVGFLFSLYGNYSIENLDDMDFDVERYAEVTNTQQREEI
ncbi:hypothetical protein LCGC14_2695330 [marine sediment metagenome]|uniref:Uncharacterized protein n=1 Tax=marine sediment metagenome TaxID=412755 RepID=A0A0F9C918_9ZZZZ